MLVCCTFLNLSKLPSVPIIKGNYYDIYCLDIDFFKLEQQQIHLNGTNIFLLFMKMHSHTFQLYQSHHQAVQQTKQQKRIKGRGKAIPIQTWTGPEISRKLRLPDLVGT